MIVSRAHSLCLTSPCNSEILSTLLCHPKTPETLQTRDFQILKLVKYNSHVTLPIGHVTLLIGHVTLLIGHVTLLIGHVTTSTNHYCTFPLLCSDQLHNITLQFCSDYLTKTKLNCVSIATITQLHNHNAPPPYLMPHPPLRTIH